MTEEQAEIRRILERYSLAVAVSGDGIWEYPAVDPTLAFHREIPVYYSPRFAEMLGFTYEEFPQIAGSWWDLIYPDDVATASRVIMEHLARRTPLRSVYRMYTKNREVRWWHVLGDTIPDNEHPGKVRAIGVVRDITELKVAEEQARAQVEVITRQQSAIRALSTPLIQVWEGILTVPLVGTIDAERASEIMDRLLSEVVRLRIRFAIMDMTGVEAVDSTTAEQLYRIIRAVGLLGGQVRLSGLNPAIAQTMTDLGVDISPFVTHRNLQDALQACIRDSARPRRR